MLPAGGFLQSITGAAASSCPAASTGQATPLAARGDGDLPRWRLLNEGDARPGMIPR